MRLHLIGFVMVALAVTACAEQSAMRIAADTVRIHVSTAPIYGSLEPERRVMRMAAEETIKSGFDRFLIVGGASDFKPNVIGYTPSQYQSTGSATVTGAPGGMVGSATSQSSYTGPRPVAMPRFESTVVIKMFKFNDPAGANGLDARAIIKQDAKG